MTKTYQSTCTRPYRKIELKKRDNKRGSRRNSGARQRSTFIWKARVWRAGCAGWGRLIVRALLCSTLVLNVTPLYNLNASSKVSICSYIV